MSLVAVLIAAAPAAVPTDPPRMHACLVRAKAIGEAANAAVARHAFALGSHFFVLHGESIDACGATDAREFGPGVRLFAADRYLKAGQAAHLAGDDSRARHLVRLALGRLQRLRYIDPEPAALYNLDLTDFRESAEDDLRGTWTIF